MTNDKKSKGKKENKGVRVNEDDAELISLPSRISEDIEPHSPQYISVHRVRDQLKNVIEKMGPNTNASDNENDDTICSSFENSLAENLVQGNEKEIKVQNLSITDDTTQITSNIISDINSQLTAYNVSELEETPIVKTTETSIQTSYVNILCPNIQNSNIPAHSFCPHYNMATNENYEKGDFVKPINFQRVSRFASWFGLKNKQECPNCSKPLDLYRINIEPNEDNSPPRRLVFDLMDELPKADTKNIATNTKQQSAFTAYIPSENVKVKINKSPSRSKSQSKDTIMERVDMYYFDHGNPEYYRTTDSPPIIKTEYIAERTDHYTKKFWAEIFGTLNIGVSFVISFILQFLRFILQAILRPLTIGIVQLVSDYFFKPCLAVSFNGVFQPPMIFLYNLMTSLRDICAPIADSLGYFIREISVMCKAVRLVQIDNGRICSKPIGRNCVTE